MAIVRFAARAFSADWRPLSSGDRVALIKLMNHYIHGGPAAFRFELAGDLNAGDAAELEQELRSASPTIGDRVLVFDLTFVTGIDEVARTLFRRWYDRGAEFAARSTQSRELVESITERPYTRESPHELTYQPWFSYTKA
jgi:hypothetical protein